MAGRKGLLAAIAGLIIVSTASLGLSSAATAATTMRVAHSSNPGQSVYIYFDELAQRVNNRSDGELALKVFPSGQLGGDEQITRSLKTGTVSMGSVASSNLGIVTDAYFFGDLPYVYRSRDGAVAVFQDASIKEYIGKKMREDAGTVVLGHIEVGGFRILINSKRELMTPGEIQGMKFRMLSNPIDKALLSSWGATPTPMPWSEVFTNIEQGIADGLQLQPQAITGFSFDKVVKFGTHTQTLMTFHVAQVNAQDWDALSPELKDVVLKASEEALKIANDADRADEAKHLEAASKTITFYTPTDAELSQWREPALKVWDQFKDKIDPTIMQRVLDVQK